MQRLARVLTVAALMVGAVALYAAVAMGHDGGGGHGGKGERHGRGHGHGHRHGAPLLKQSLAPSLPSDPAFHGVAAGGLPWLLDRGEVRIKADGKLKLRVRGLVIPNPPGDGTAGPVTSITASLYCGPDTDTAAADTTDPVPLTPSGDARIFDRSFNVPSTCLAPIVMVHPNGIPAAYIAISGWRS